MSKIILLAVLLGFSSITQGRTAEAIFAGGCFWCLEADFDKVKGVLSTISGFDGGKSPDPTYEEVAAGNTGYAEAVLVVYNPDQISYEELLDFYWHHIDPTTKDAEFCDQGHQYRSAIFYLNDAQKKMALASRKKIAGLLPQVYTEVVPSTTFYAADEYHQNYSHKNPLRYRYYRYRCGRDARVDEVWANVKN